MLGDMSAPNDSASGLRSAENRPHTILLAGILLLAALIVGGLGLQTWRTPSAHREASRKVLQDYSAFAVQSFGSRIRPGASIYRRRDMHPALFASIEQIGGLNTTLTAVVAIDPSVRPRLIVDGLPPSPLGTVLPLVSLAIALFGVAVYLTSRRKTAALERRARLSEARLGALRGQLHPHFLFNVLNTIAMLAQKGDNKAVVSALTQLSDLLRTLLRESPREEVPLRGELDFVTRYLALEKLRFQERLVIEIDSPVELEDALVPTLILQPLVENAIRHGVGARDGQGKVSIRASRSGDLLRLEVTDNGPGLSAGSPLDTASGIGLRNSRERLAQLYGSAATLNVVSTTGGGVMATVSLPLRTTELRDVAIAPTAKR